MYRVIGQNMSVQHVQEDTGDESLHHHEMPRDLNTFYRAYSHVRGLCFNSSCTFRLFFLYATCLQGRLGYPDAGVN